MAATLGWEAPDDSNYMGISEDARGRVKLWLCDEPTVAPRDLVWRPVAANVAAAAAVDRPGGARLLTPAQAAVWGLTHEELLALGLRNLASEPRPAGERLNDEVTVYRGVSEFVASLVLALDALFPETAEHGAVVAVPSRRTLLVHTIRDLGVVEAFVPMLQATQLLWEQDRDAISNQLFWYRHGTLERLPVPGMGNGHGGTTPSDFRRLLLRLPPPQHGRG